ncbi:thermonuclease family protein [Haladaptatus caseinilyticus]|uniref:thermonuclease family protein n=1 Tax=Haladaptatus caseinilyticus TaxID=2993314 RepID=UPI00224A9F8E|nr:thermonuclease family protein [Haladaptatus caseinilyticus]
MQRSLPLFGLVLIIVLAGCLGGLGFGGSSDAATTTTGIETQTTSIVSSTTAPADPTTATTTITETQTQPRTQTTFLRQPTTANIDTPEDSERFQARVTKVIDPTTLTIKYDGKNRTIDLIGVSVPESSPIHKKAVRYTKSQMDHQVVTVVSDPQVNATDNGRMQAYVYIGNFMFNTDLVRIGYARILDGQFSKRQKFMRKQQQAKQRGYGLWNTTSTSV